MPTSKPAPNKRSGPDKLSLLIIAVLLSVVGYFGFRLMRGLVMLGYVDSAVVRMRLLYAADTQFAKAHPTLGYTCTLSQLPSSDEVQRLVAKNRIENGYTFEIVDPINQEF